jgi:Fe/S biogenesis protein NfuA
MIELDIEAAEYFRGLLSKQDLPGLGIRLTALNPGTAKGDCRLQFCESVDVTANDYVIECSGFNLYVDLASQPYLDGASLSFSRDKTGGELVIKAPKLKLSEPGREATLMQRVQYVLDSEINPGVAAHGGHVTLLAVDNDGVVTLQFGGGCHGCGMKDVTLKQGIETTLRTRVPQVSRIIDSTDHSSGAAPYYPSA